MSGISLVTKGFIAPIITSVISSSKGGGGSPPVHAQEHLPKPFIKVGKIQIDGNKNEVITKDNFRVKNVKIIVDQKD